MRLRPIYPVPKPYTLHVMCKWCGKRTDACKALADLDTPWSYYCAKCVEYLRVEGRVMTLSGDCEAAHGEPWPKSGDYENDLV